MKKSERTKMTKRQKKKKKTSILSCFAKQREKESIEIKEHEQKTDSSRPTCFLLSDSSASQSTEFDSAEERINLDRPVIASDDIAKILPSNRSNSIAGMSLVRKV